MKYINETLLQTEMRMLNYDNVLYYVALNGKLNYFCMYRYNSRVFLGCEWCIIMQCTMTSHNM